MPDSLDSPEFRLILSCCRVNPTNIELANRAKVLVTAIDEKYFLTLVRRHMLSPIVFHNLHNEPAISDLLKEELKSLVKKNQIQAILAKQMIVRLQTKFIELNVKGLFFKGVTLSEKYYHDIGLRENIDIDLWVDSTGFIKVSNYLKSIGYRSNLDLGKLNKKQIAYKYRTDHHLLFRTDDPCYPPVIELHWKIRGRLGVFTFDPEFRYDEIVYLNSNEMDIPVFSEIDNFLFLCTHGCDHAWYRLKWLFDLPQMLDTIIFDWTKVMSRAEELNCKEQLMLTFLVLNRFLNQSIPPTIQQSIATSNLKWSLKYIESCILNDGDFCSTDKDKVLNLYYNFLRNKRGIFNKTIILRHLTSEKDWFQLPLPESLFFLYFPLRPLLLIWRRLSKYFVQRTFS